MNRRGFLSLLAPAAALIAVPELLIPKRSFFLPPAGGWNFRYPPKKFWGPSLLEVGDIITIEGIRARFLIASVAQAENIKLAAADLEYYRGDTWS